MANDQEHCCQSLHITFNHILTKYLNSRVSFNKNVTYDNDDLSNFTYRFDERYLKPGQFSGSNERGVRHTYHIFENGDKQLYIYHGNILLTFDRIKNISQLLIGIKQVINNDNIPANDKYTQLNSKILDAIRQNNLLTRKYNKYHYSYRQAKAEGLSFLSALWKRTFCQSRANTALEECLEILKKNECTLNPTQQSKCWPPPTYPGSS